MVIKILLTTSGINALLWVLIYVEPYYFPGPQVEVQPTFFFFLSESHYSKVRGHLVSYWGPPLLHRAPQ